MKRIAFFTAAALALFPAMAVAQGCPFGKHDAAMSCASGSVWDADSRRCVTDITG